MVFSARMGKASVAVGVAAALLASCGGTADDGGPAAVTATVDLSVLGPTDAATGSAVKVGFISDGKTPAADLSPEVDSARATVEYVNAHLGGIKGHPVELEVCTTGLTPAGAADCANRMVDAGVAIVLGGTPGVVAPIAEILQTAGIPYFVHSAVDQAAILSPNSFVLANILGFTAAPVEVAKAAGYQKAATVLIDVPAAVGPFTLLTTPIYEKAGITNDLVTVPPGTPDMSPQLQTALANGPELFTVIGDTAFCTAALKGLDALGFTGTIVLNAQCYSTDLAGAVADGVDGVLVASTVSADPNDAEVALYEAVLSTFAPDLEPGRANAREGYAVTLAFVRAMNAGLEGDLTPDAARLALIAAPAQPLPLLAGETFQCNRKQYKLAPAICSSGMVVWTLDAEAGVRSSAAVDVRPYFEAGA